MCTLARSVFYILCGRGSLIWPRSEFDTVCFVLFRTGYALTTLPLGAYSPFLLPCRDSAESTLHPAVFEAIASLRGDVANESVQHRELSVAISKDVLEPLGQLKETAEMVVRVVSLWYEGSHECLFAFLFLSWLRAAMRNFAPTRAFRFLPRA